MVFSKKCLLLVLALGFTTVGGRLTLAVETLAFSALEDSGPQEVAKSVLREAYRRIGISIDFVTMPGERALLESNAGRNDGEVVRIGGIEKKYSNLIRVPVSISQLDGVAFTKHVSIPIEGWHSLKGHSIGAFTGSKFVENNTTDMEVTYVPGVKNLFAMLQRNRLDLVVIPYLSGLRYIKNHSISGFKALSPPLITIKLYHYLHKKNRSLLPKITKSLEIVQKNNRIRQLRREYIASLQISP